MANRKAFLLTLVSLIAFLCSAQHIINPYRLAVTGGVSCDTVSDAFSNGSDANGTSLDVRTDGSAASWVLNLNDIVIWNNVAKPNSTGSEMGAGCDDFGACDDQYSQASGKHTSSRKYGVGVRHSSTGGTATYYGWYDNSGSTATIFKMVAGSKTVITTSGDWADNSVVKLEVSGTSLEGYDDGVSEATGTDSAISSGVPGIVFYDVDALNCYADDFQGGQL